ncbi:Hypothetical predicted protein [Paramuricea clavata]|uniref:Uncharacterized protein n=1 Tax=Paramuricea clavata TaxID=317549 RepID=A0A6S7GQC9_PARCT|nr:Hypothetical predicted protein [Paramuricea clavata]
MKEFQKISGQIDTNSKKKANTKSKQNVEQGQGEKEKAIEFLSDQYDDLLSYNSKMKKYLDRLGAQLNEISMKVERIEKILDSFESYSYQYGAKIIGVPEINTKESSIKTTKLCVDLFNAMGANVSAQDIDIAHRVSDRSSCSSEGKPKPIICKFVRRLSKESVMKLRKEAGKINSSDLGFNATLDIKIAIFDYLTPKPQKLLYEAKNSKQAIDLNTVGPRNNQVYLREHENSHTYKISDLQDLRRLESSDYECSTGSRSDCG